MPSGTKAARVDAFGGDAPVAKTSTISPSGGRAALFGTSSSKHHETTSLPYIPAACSSANATVLEQLASACGCASTCWICR
jgi:hypothetical protein